MLSTISDRLGFCCSFFRLSVAWFLWQVTPLMFLEVAAVYESFPTDHAVIRPFSRVDPSVQLEAAGLSEPPAADVAAIHLLP